MHAVYFAGVPCVAWSSWCGRRPKALMAVSRMARPIVAFARKPEPTLASCHVGLPSQSLAQRFASPGNHSEPQTSCAVSTIRASLAHC